MSPHKREQPNPDGPTNPLPPEDLTGEKSEDKAGESDPQHQHGIQGDHGSGP